jgi:antitoxin component HigA of HigAB toxin-antitoxin module
MSLGPLDAYREAVHRVDEYLQHQRLRSSDAPRGRMIAILASAFEKHDTVTASDIEVILVEQLRAHASRIADTAFGRGSP